MNLPCLVVFAVLGASPNPDGGVKHDAGPPPWVPRSKRVDLTEEAYYGLRREGDGYVYESAQFEAHVARDGVVSFRDKHGSLNLWPLPSSFTSAPRPKGPTLESTLRDHFDKRRRPTPPPAPEPGPPPHRIDWNDLYPEGSNGDPRGKPMMLTVQGNFDLTDEIMRAYGQDPYAREKARFLSSTFELRIRMAIAARKEDMRSALEHLPERLEELWSDERYTQRERRRILYELWYETDQTPAGERAARTIDAFIRRRLPCGSPEGYGAAELDAFRRVHPERQFPPAADCERAAPK
jgi:hypothetical protein